MDAAAVAGLCAVLAHGGAAGPLADGLVCPPAAVAAAERATGAPLQNFAPALGAPSAREAIARVSFAEAGNQGDSGLAAVVYAILNRLADGRWGASVEQVLNARGQFEPVMRVGGDWRGLPAVSPAQQARIDTILNLVLDGRLPDLTDGARFFQNPAIVARRARNGEVSAGLVGFGGAAPSAVIGAHAFYRDPGRGPRAGSRVRAQRRAAAPEAIFVGENRAATAADAPPAPDRPTADAAQALFIGSEGRPGDGRR
jgi:hypothetical protein